MGQDIYGVVAVESQFTGSWNYVQELHKSRILIKSLILMERINYKHWCQIRLLSVSNTF